MSDKWSVHLRYLIFLPLMDGGLRYNSVQIDVAKSTEYLMYIKEGGPAWYGENIGYTFIAWDGVNKGMSSLISGANKRPDNSIESYILESPIIPFDGYTFSIIDFGNEQTRFRETGEIVDISQYVSSVRFDTDIEKGFSDASIKVDNYSSLAARALGRIEPVDVMIYDEYGEMVYNGIMTENTIDGYSGEIHCKGYSITNDWFFAVSTYPAEDATVTAPAIIREQMMQNHFLRKGHQNGIDPGDVLATAQSTDGTYSGIGPFDFEDTPTTVQEAFDNVTKFGYYPADPYKDYFLQIWFDRIMGGWPTNREIKDGDWIKWTLDEKNFSDDSSNVSITVSYEDIRTSKRVVYTDVDGATQRTQSAHGWPFTNWFGNVETQATSSSLGAGRAYDILRESVSESPDVVIPGNIKASGLAKLTGGGMMRPVYHIRAWDPIEIIMPIGANYSYPSIMGPGFKLIVGKTSYDSETNIMTITAHTSADLLERQLMVSDLRDV